MEHTLNAEFTPSSLALGTRAFDLLAVTIVCLAYTTTLFVTHDPYHLGRAIIGGVANTVPIILLGGVVRRLIIERIAGRAAVIQLLSHGVLCLAFSLLSFWVLIILLGMVNGRSPFEFDVQPFAKGNAWQLLENATTYAVIAALSYLQIWRPLPSRVSAKNILPVPPNAASRDSVRPQTTEVSRHFIRCGDDILPVDVDRVICITGADDYADVATLDRHHLVRMTLAQFEQTLDAARFVRVHRSAIVNVDRVERAEPAGGGRLRLHMVNGQIIQASRTGSRLLRARVI